MKPKVVSGRCSNRRIAFHLASVAALTLLSGCYSLGASGPGTKDVLRTAEPPVASRRAAGIKVVDLTDEVVNHLHAAHERASFAKAFGDGVGSRTLVGLGDTLDISVWEAPPAALFGSVAQTQAIAGNAGRLTSSPAVSQASSLPEQMVDDNGLVVVPFAGSVVAAGRTPAQIARTIEERLKGKAHDPQVIVRVTRNAAQGVTVVGDVVQNIRVPLNPSGDRLLDVLAAAGGTKQAITKINVQITRDGRVISMPLESVIRTPSENIHLQPNDVVTALYQNYSFTALGAVGRNAEIDFESTGISLVQALGRINGLRDDRADIKGVFIFRLEDPQDLDPAIARDATLTPEGKVPVIYRVNLKDAAAFFYGQKFEIQDKDVLYVSNAPVVDLLKFVNIVSGLAFTTTAIGNGL
jgi:polysaccharide export outer membrane protein